MLQGEDEASGARVAPKEQRECGAPVPRPQRARLESKELQDGTWGLACSSSSPWPSSWDWRESEWDGGIGEKGARHRAGALSSCGTCRSQAPEAQQPHQQLFP